MIAVKRQRDYRIKSLPHKSTDPANSVNINMNADRAKKKQFEEIFMPFLDASYRMALRLTSDPDDAADLVQDTCLKAYRFFATFRTGSNARAWIMMILINTFRTNYRKLQKEPARIDYESVQNLLAAEDRDPLGAIARNTEMSDIRKITEYMRYIVSDDITNALDSVPERYRTPVLLADAEQFNYEEISDILGINIGTVKSRIFRGRGILKKKLLDFAVKRGICHGR